MANPYIYSVVTVDGAALIAQATAANPIVYVAALSKASAAESDADLSTKPASWYDGKTVTKLGIETYDSEKNQQTKEFTRVSHYFSKHNGDLPPDIKARYEAYLKESC